MKKKLIFQTMLACLLTLGLALVACGDDDDDEGAILIVTDMEDNGNYAWIISSYSIMPSYSVTKSQIDEDLDKIFGTVPGDLQYFIAGSHSGAAGVTFSKQFNSKYRATIPLYSNKEFTHPWRKTDGYFNVWLIKLTPTRTFYKNVFFQNYDRFRGDLPIPCPMFEFDLVP